MSKYPLKHLSFSKSCKKAKTARMGHVTQSDLLTINMTAGSGVCLRMWIMEKSGGHCPSLEATNRVLGKDREPYVLAFHIHIRNEMMSHWADLRPQGSPPLGTGLLFKAMVLPLATLFWAFGRKTQYCIPITLPGPVSSMQHRAHQQDHQQHPLGWPIGRDL